MTSRRAALVAAVLLAPAVWIAGPAGAQACQPKSAELALEELLDIAADGSPLEDRARLIADEQDARNAFESAETIRRIEELAHANDLAFDCTRRRYVPAQRPDPREAIANDQEPVDDGPDGRTAPAVAPKPGTTGGSTSPSVGGTTGQPGTVSGTAAPGDGGSGTGSSGTPADPLASPDVDGAADPDAAPSGSAAGSAGGGRRPGSGRGGRSGGDTAAVQAGDEDIAAPGEARLTGAGAVAVVESGSSGTARTLLAATAAAAVTGMLGALAMRRRRQQATPMA